MDRAASPEGAAGPRPARRLDCRGLYCPLPVLRTRRALAELAVGEELEVIATDPAAVIDMAVLSQRSGHPLVGQERRGKELIFRFVKAAPGSPD